MCVCMCVLSARRARICHTGGLPISKCVCVYLGACVYVYVSKISEGREEVCVHVRGCGSESMGVCVCVYIYTLSHLQTPMKHIIPIFRTPFIPHSNRIDVPHHQGHQDRVKATEGGPWVGGGGVGLVANFVPGKRDEGVLDVVD